MTGQSLVASPDERPGHKQKLMERGAGKTALFFILLKPKRRGETRNPFYPLKLTCSLTSYYFFFRLFLSTLFRVDSDDYFFGLFFTAGGVAGGRPDLMSVRFSFRLILWMCCELHKTRRILKRTSVPFRTGMLLLLCCVAVPW
jgi:hypothetical protein